MPKTPVAINCEVTDKSLKMVKSDDVKKAVIASIKKAIDANSLLTSSGSGTGGFVLLAKVILLKGDNPKTPTKIEGKVLTTVAAAGSSGVKIFNATTGATAEGVGSDVQGKAEEVATDIVEAQMAKLIPALTKTMKKTP
jgi:hypothetical protein